jgi:hypothetical protein
MSGDWVEGLCTLAILLYLAEGADLVLFAASPPQMGPTVPTA